MRGGNRSARGGHRRANQRIVRVRHACAHKAAEHRGSPTSPCFQQGFSSLSEEIETHWYALDVLRQKEYLAGHILQRMGCQTFIPTETKFRRKNRYAKKKTEIAFAALPGVVFAGFSGPPNWYDVMRLSVVTGVLSLDGKPRRIRTDTKEWVAYRSSQLDGHMVVERVKSLYRGQEIDRSQKSIFVQGRGILRAPKEQKHMRSKLEFKIGDEMMVAEGPFRQHI